MTIIHPLALLKLRLLVGYLGESAQFGWWTTAYFTKASDLFLEPVFSKTSGLAKYHGTLEAARRLHDEHLSVSSYHLFRLPEEVEQNLHALAQSHAGEEIVSTVLCRKEEALNALQQLAPRQLTVSEGPIAIGGMKEIYAPDGPKAVAGVYLSGFLGDFKAYPYFAQ